MLGAIHFNDQLCRCAIKIYNKSADDSLFVNFRWVFAEEKIPQLAFMGCHFSAKPPGILQLAIIFWHGHFYPLRPRFARPPLPKGEASPSPSASPPALPKGEPRSAPNAPHRRVYRSAPLYLFEILEFDLLLFLHQQASNQSNQARNKG